MPKKGRLTSEVTHCSPRPGQGPEKRLPIRGPMDPSYLDTVTLIMLQVALLSNG